MARPGGAGELGDQTVAVAPLIGRVADWRRFLDGGLDAAALERLRRHGRSGHAVGTEACLETLERAPGRGVKPRPPGRPKSVPAASHSR